MKNQKTEIQKLEEEHRLALSRISHEIRNPVTLINSSMQIIEAEHPEVSTFTFWPEMKEDMAFLRRLLDEFSGYNNSDRQLVPEKIDTCVFLSEIASGAKALSENPDVTFSWNIPDTLPVIIADRTKLRQAVTNLLRNAFESGASRVSMDCLTKNELLEIHISDNGCGISKEVEKDLFTPFVTHKPNGTGLGLSIVKRIMEAHNGKIVYSSGNPGACFSLLLPTKIAASRKPAAIPPKCAI